MVSPTDFQASLPELAAWRRDIHAHPETAFEEVRTGDLVAAKLASWGIDVHRGLAKTGVVGTLRAGSGTRAIGLRADMDALNMQELNDFAHRSTIAGKMHACGHDGHTTMLLAAARHLARHRGFDGAVHFIFQPAEENEGGGRVMVQEGLFERFPCDAVYGMHNMPGIPVGRMAVQAGPALASSDSWEVVMRGRGTHGAKPHLGTDATVAAANFILALQTIVSRSVDPLESAAVSLGSIAAGVPETWNVIPAEVRLRGTARAFRPEIRDLLEASIGRVADGAARAHGCRADYRYIRRNPPVVNTKANAEIAARAAARALGAENVLHDFPPSTAGEDFSFMLEKVPGAYVWVGIGPGEEGCLHHNPRYDFNDGALPVGAAFWVSLVETELPARG
ncbi:MAG: amidohydrolase [Alphaproteobacteria bacterium]|nr:amidohydrolase [Alphaproteobacteria bacterium]